jgi:hypothetical protein
MKKAIALTLAATLVLSAVLFFPSLTEAALPAGTCYDNWDVCRSRAFQSEEGVLRTTVLLTVCDFGLGKCLLGY